jgi:hypothetical protein
MRERRHWKIINLLLALTGVTLVTLSTIRGQEVPFSDAYSRVLDSPMRNVFVIGFVGRFVSRDDVKHPEVQFADYLRARYPTIHAEVFGNPWDSTKRRGL